MWKGLQMPSVHGGGSNMVVEDVFTIFGIAVMLVVLWVAREAFRSDKDE